MKFVNRMSFYKIESKFLDDIIAGFELVGGVEAISKQEQYIIKIKVMCRWVCNGRGKEISSYINNNWDSGGGDEFILPVSECMVSQGLVSDLKYLWRGVVGVRKKSYYRSCKAAQKLCLDNINANQSVVRRKRELLVALDNYEAALSQLGHADKKILEIRHQIENGAKSKASRTTDERKMDDDVFWTLINESRSEAEGIEEIVDILRDKLERMRASEIRKFQKQLYQKLADLADWDLWALAYIVRGGCSDDAFEYFRAWVVLQGKDYFDLAVKDVASFAREFDWSEDPQAEDLLYIASEAYENIKLEPMPYITRAKEKMRGMEWIETDLSDRYKDYYAACKL